MEWVATNENFIKVHPGLGSFANALNSKIPTGFVFDENRLTFGGLNWTKNSRPSSELREKLARERATLIYWDLKGSSRGYEYSLGTSWSEGSLSSSALINPE